MNSFEYAFNVRLKELVAHDIMTKQAMPGSIRLPPGSLSAIEDMGSKLLRGGKPLSGLAHAVETLGRETGSDTRGTLTAAEVLARRLARLAESPGLPVKYKAPEVFTPPDPVTALEKAGPNWRRYEKPAPNTNTDMVSAGPNWRRYEGPPIYHEPKQLGWSEPEPNMALEKAGPNWRRPNGPIIDADQSAAKARLAELESRISAPTTSTWENVRDWALKNKKFIGIGAAGTGAGIVGEGELASRRNDRYKAPAPGFKDALRALIRTI